jgi:hypothetical protein
VIVFEASRLKERDLTAAELPFFVLAAISVIRKVEQLQF